MIESRRLEWSFEQIIKRRNVGSFPCVIWCLKLNESSNRRKRRNINNHWWWPLIFLHLLQIHFPKLLKINLISIFRYCLSLLFLTFIFIACFIGFLERKTFNFCELCFSCKHFFLFNHNILFYLLFFRGGMEVFDDILDCSVFFHPLFMVSPALFIVFSAINLFSHFYEQVFPLLAFFAFELVQMSFEKSNITCILTACPSLIFFIFLRMESKRRAFLIALRHTNLSFLPSDPSL